MNAIQFFMTPAAGKSLIGKVLMQRQDIREAMSAHTLAIVAGTTNTYVAREALRLIGEEGALDDKGFYRGIVKPGSVKPSLPMLEGDVIIRQGKWLKGAVINDVASELGREDILLKGANAVHLPTGEAGVLIGNPVYGTMAFVTEAVLGRGAKLVVPVSVEKRVDRTIFEIIRMNNASRGLRISAMPGTAYTELDAIAQMGGVDPCIVASGGICGYEGGCYYCCGGTDEALQTIKEAVALAMEEKAFAL